MHVDGTSNASSAKGILANLPGARVIPGPMAMTLEVAVYTAKDPRVFPRVHRNLHRWLTTFAGYEGALRLESVKGERLFADLVAWSNYDAAEMASHRIEHDELFTPVRVAIGDVRLFARYTLTDDPKKLFDALASSPIIEVAAYGVRSSDVDAALQARLIGRLQRLDGFRVATALTPVSDNEPQLRGDLIGWQSISSHEQTAQDLASDPELRLIPTGVIERSVLGLFASR